MHNASATLKPDEVGLLEDIQYLSQKICAVSLLPHVSLAFMFGDLLAKRAEIDRFAIFQTCSSVQSVSLSDEACFLRFLC